MASTFKEIQAAFGRGDTNPGFHDAHIVTPGKGGAKNTKLAFSILDGTFFGGDKLSPELQNLRTSVQGPCCDILNTLKQK